MKIDTKLKRARNSACLSQVEIAERAKITERSYQRYESGERTPNVHTAIRIARVLDSTVEELFGIAVPDNKNTTK